MYLVDTDVLSAGAPAKAERQSELATWMDRNSERLFLSVVTLAEIVGGVAKLRREGAVRKADRLGEWLETVLHLYVAQIIPIDVGVAGVLGELSDRARGPGKRRGGQTSRSLPRRRAAG